MYSEKSCVFTEGQILLVDKPLEWTSFEVVKKIRWKICKYFNLKKIKVGHAGTLDPKASGLLIICTGKATKEIDNLQKYSKIYSGRLKLGATTPCYDTEMPENQRFPIDHISDKDIYETAKKFKGKIQQCPPSFSAIQQGGKRLYKLARKGIKVEVQSREVEIFQLDIIFIDMPYVDFSVHCGKGTYIRSLAHDLGKNLQSGAYLTALRREQIKGFSVKDADPNILTEAWPSQI
ncbi:tRNA pseudouridine(55) synthase TruB [Bacteroidetes bacterium endosymbiont of Geopemphigus sp.]|uniref:tRNA pseudouridine(55) synthase TruB n=1 Tax=Bacteroidetes bacterium endosymbiont of Geopemphigus sp. TaxID=2047937 RepID=UPI000CD0F06C|nr:tRNA pseudouridine(55) synthase TruB [Bacteroidetes bacterium endosymbiont of Geopemphigus sp.]